MILGFAGAEEVAQYAAHEFVRRARSAIEASGAFKVALAGGSTPRRTYELLGETSLSGQVDWEAVHVFFGDERSVPPDHVESNYHTALAALLGRVKIPEAQVHRMEGERSDLEAAARDYAKVLVESFDLSAESRIPRFDLVMLGIGEDGHTASLFPDTRALDETKALVVANDVPQKSTRRLTLTTPVLNAARCVMFTVSGEDKAGPLAEVLEGPRDPLRLPAQLVEPADGEILWLVDRAAAANLKTRPRNPSTSRSSP